MGSLRSDRKNTFHIIHRHHLPCLVFVFTKIVKIFNPWTSGEKKEIKITQILSPRGK